MSFASRLIFAFVFAERVYVVLLFHTIPFSRPVILLIDIPFASLRMFRESTAIILSSYVVRSNFELLINETMPNLYPAVHHTQLPSIYSVYISQASRNSANVHSSSSFG